MCYNEKGMKLFPKKKCKGCDTLNLGSLLRKKRKEKKLTLEQVGEAIGVSKNTVSKYERNIIDNIGRSKVIALSKLLDIPTIAFIEAFDESETNEVSPQEFKQEVSSLLSKTTNLSEQEKNLLLQTLNVICSDKE